MASLPPLDIGSRLEPLVDDLLIDRFSGAAGQRLHHPQPQELALTHDAPWEGSACGYHTVFRDGDRYRMYYKTWHIPPDGAQDQPVMIAYAESRDGIEWVKPELGLVEFAGSRDNNLVFTGVGGRAHDFSVFLDDNPAAAPEARYKAVGRGQQPKGFYAFKSADGLRWSLMQDEPILTGLPFDTQNIVFWDATIQQYRAYVRAFRESPRGEGQKPWRCRDVQTAVSDDMLHWSTPQWLRYPGSPDEELYTNQVKPYERAPHLLIGLPARYVDRGWIDATAHLPEPELRRQRAGHSQRYGSAVTDALIMFSRDGLHFCRWPEALLRPGLRTRHNWSYGDNYIGWHLVQTPSARDDSPAELSLYATESYFTGRFSRLRRYTLRLDGFVSVHAPLHGGEVLTRPLRIAGEDLLLNYSTSAGGGIWVEVQDEAGAPVEGFALDQCPELFGDELARPVRWAGGRRAGELAGRAVRLRIVLRDADLFALRFGASEPR